jgi:hypothetical protein
MSLAGKWSWVAPLVSAGALGLGCNSQGDSAKLQLNVVVTGPGNGVDAGGFQTTADGGATGGSNSGAATAGIGQAGADVAATSTQQVDTLFSDANGWGEPSAYTTIRYPDVNGDGRSDACGRNARGIWCAVDDGSGNKVSYGGPWLPFFGDANGWGVAAYYATIAFPDVDGDGMADVCGRGVDGIYCARSTGAGFEQATLWTTAFDDASDFDAPAYYATLTFADIDGDAKADVCGRGVDGVYCGLSTGGAFADVGLWSTSFADSTGWGAPQYFETLHFPDVDGDGKADVCGRGVDGIECGTSTGRAFGAVDLWSSSFSDAAQWGDAPYYATLSFSDIDEDGKMDVCGRGVGGVSCALSVGTSFGVASIWNAGFGDASGWSGDAYGSTLHYDRNVVCGRSKIGVECAFSRVATVGFNGGPTLESSTESDLDGWNEPKYYSTIALTKDHEIIGRGASGLWARSLVLSDELSIATASDLVARRTALIEKIWNTATLDTSQGVDQDMVVSSLTVPAPDIVPPAAAGVVIHRYTISTAGENGTPTLGVADHYVVPGAKNLAIVNPGHSCHYDIIPYQDVPTVLALLAEGYSVLATYMPAYSPLDCTSQHNVLFDPRLGRRPASGQSPLVYFLDPVRRSLNQALSDFGYDRVMMAGLSGGGWTTTMYAALDPRVVVSVPVAGSSPMNMRWPSDAEQEDCPEAGNDFFDFTSNGVRVVTGYKDLYLLGSYGAGRRQVQVLNRNDDCCFGQNEYTAFSPPWDQSARAYEVQVRQRIEALGAGSFHLEINEADDDCAVVGTCPLAPTKHEYSANTRVNGILAAFNGSNAFLGSADDATPFGRNSSGDLASTAGAGQPWVDTGLAMVGAPAVVRNVLQPVDLFYRDPVSNVLTHAAFDGANWSVPNDIPSPAPLVSDPVLSSWGGQRIDVVGIGKDYGVVHWVYRNGAWAFDQPFLAGTPVHAGGGAIFAVGQAAVTTTSNDACDVFFRGKDDRLYHVALYAGTASLEGDVGPTANIKNFPAAASSSTTPSVFVVGADDALYQGGSVGGAWTWSNVSMIAGSGAVRGSPSALGAQAIYARVSTSTEPNQLGLFSMSGAIWAFSEEGRGANIPLLGSPTATSSGVLALDASHVGWFLDTASAWNGLSGYIDR